MPGTEDAREVTACEAAAYIKVGDKCIYREVRAGRLRAARVGGRRELRFRAAWLDEYLDRSAAPVEIHR
jgi:excisionase family DNA binding protein